MSVTMATHCLSPASYPEIVELDDGSYLPLSIEDSGHQELCCVSAAQWGWVCFFNGIDAAGPIARPRRIWRGRVADWVDLRPGTVAIRSPRLRTGGLSLSWLAKHSWWALLFFSLVLVAVEGEAGSSRR